MTKNIYNYFLRDSQILSCSSGNEDVEIEDINKKYKGRGVDGGYYIRFKQDKVVVNPVKTCLSISKSKKVQNVDNEIICEKGSRGEVITGCNLTGSPDGARHNGQTVIKIGKGAKLVYTMIHQWKEDTIVRPKTKIIVEDGGEFVSNYVCVDRVANIKMYPSCFLGGDKTSASFNSIILAREGSLFDIGAEVILKGVKSKCLIRSKVVTRGGKVINRGRMIGKGKGANGFLECKGMVIRKGLIHAIPEIKACRENVDLSHEASVGKIDGEIIEYLQTRGFNKDKAIDLIVRGFLDMSDMDLPRSVGRMIEKVSVMIK